MTDKLEYIIRHVFLPPRLPQGDDWDEIKNVALINSVLDALREHDEFIPIPDRSRWHHCRQMLQRIIHFRDDRGGLVTERLASSLNDLIDGGPPDFFVIRDLTRESRR